MDEGQVLVHHWVDGDDGGPGIADQVPIAPEVHGRVHQGQHVRHQSTVLDRNFVPRGLQTSDDHVVQTGNDGKHRVEVLSLFVRVLGNLENEHNFR